MTNSKRAAIGVVMGSISDLDKVQPALDLFSKFNVPFEVSVISAHRNPDVLKEYAASAEQRAVKVLIAAAGLSAALPGVLASFTVLPVIGLPVASGTLGGVDALLSTIQMPPGVPVGSVGIDAGRNAALFALRILAISDDTLAAKLSSYREDMSQEALKRNSVLVERGFTVWFKDE
jgi:5-(carboxyamino)imidazole ribonucleotide mutase